jgi:hypothetical protein
MREFLGFAGNLLFQGQFCVVSQVWRVGQVHVVCRAVNYCISRGFCEGKGWGTVNCPVLSALENGRARLKTVSQVVEL